MVERFSFWAFSPLAAVIARLALVVVFLGGIVLGPTSSQLARKWKQSQEAAERSDYETLLYAWDSIVDRLGPQTTLYESLLKTSLFTRHYDAATVYLHKIVELDGWTVERQEQLRVIYEQGGYTTRATALLMATVREKHENPQMLRQLAQHQIAQLEWVQAEATLATLVSLVPDDAESFYQLGLIVAPQNPDYAVDYLARATHDPSWQERAQTILAALEVYETESRGEAHTYLGVTLVGLGEWPFAERVLDFALAANAVNPTALVYLGFVRDQQGRDGLPDIEAARAMSPNDPVVFYALGMHWRLAQQDAKAYSAFEHAFWLDSTNPALAAEVGLSLQQMNELTSAEEWLRRAIDLAPSELAWKKLLALFYADTGFNLEADGFDFIADLAQLNPDDPDLRASWGWAYAQQGDITRAYEELNAAIGLDPLNARSRYYFGAILEQQGDTDGAADSYWFVVQTLNADRGFGLLAARALQRLGYSAS